MTGAVAVQDTLRISVTAKGRAEAIRQAKLKARKSGIVSRVRVRENQFVRAGQLLVQIDTTEYALALAAQSAALRRAQAEYQVRVLGDEEITDPRVRAARDSLARAFTGLDQAEVDYRRAVKDLDETAVRAPFGGRIADVKLVAGQYVGEGEEAVTVIDMNPMKVSVQVLGTEVVYLDEGHAAQVEFTAFPGRPFTGKIETINPLVDPETNTARVTVHVSNAGRPHLSRHVRRGRPGGAEVPGSAPGAQDGDSGGHGRAPLPLRGRRRPRQLALCASRAWRTTARSSSS